MRAQLGGQRPGAPAADLAQGPERGQAGTDRDVEQVEDVGQLGGHGGAPAPRRARQPCVGRDEGAGRRGGDRRRSQAPGEQGGGRQRSGERGHRGPALERHHLGDRDRRRRAGRLEPAREVARRRRRTDAPAQAGQRRGYPGTAAAATRSAARAPDARRRELDDPSRRTAGGEDGEEQPSRHHPYRTRAMRLMSTHAISWQTPAAPSSHGAIGARSSVTT